MSASNPSQFTPNYSSPPGVMLEEWLEENQMTRPEMAQRSGHDEKTINQLIKGLVRVTPEVALDLEKATGVSASLWINMEAQYRLHLAEMIDHVLYEFEMLIHSTELLSKPHDDKKVINCILESFCIHARNLNEFFSTPSPKDNLLFPRMFFPEWSFEYKKDRNLAAQTSNTIAHLTSQRKPPATRKPWEVVDIFNKLREPMLAFIMRSRVDAVIMDYAENRERIDGLYMVLSHVAVIKDA
jgi:addiction module HigA family antidote